MAGQPGSTALLFVDVQNYYLHAAGSFYRRFSLAELQGQEVREFFQRVSDTIPTWRRLQSVCRSAGVEVVFTVVQAAESPSKHAEAVLPGSWDAQVLDEVRSLQEEMVLPRCKSSAFHSTNLDQLLRSRNKTHLIIVGCMTELSVLYTIMDASDLGYNVTIIPECCLSSTPENHIMGLRAARPHSRSCTLKQLTQQLLSNSNGSQGSLDNGTPETPTLHGTQQGAANGNRSAAAAAADSSRDPHAKHTGHARAQSQHAHGSPHAPKARAPPHGDHTQQDGGGGSHTPRAAPCDTSGTRLQSPHCDGLQLPPLPPAVGGQSHPRSARRRHRPAGVLGPHPPPPHTYWGFPMNAGPPPWYSGKHNLGLPPGPYRAPYPHPHPHTSDCYEPTQSSPSNSHHQHHHRSQHAPLSHGAHVEPEPDSPCSAAHHRPAWPVQHYDPNWGHGRHPWPCPPSFWGLGYADDPWYYASMYGPAPRHGYPWGAQHHHHQDPHGNYGCMDLYPYDRMGPHWYMHGSASEGYYSPRPMQGSAYGYGQGVTPYPGPGSPQPYAGLPWGRGGGYSRGDDGSYPSDGTSTPTLTSTEDECDDDEHEEDGRGDEGEGVGDTGRTREGEDGARQAGCGVQASPAGRGPNWEGGSNHPQVPFTTYGTTPPVRREAPTHTPAAAIWPGKAAGGVPPMALSSPESRLEGPDPNQHQTHRVQPPQRQQQRSAHAQQGCPPLFKVHAPQPHTQPHTSHINNNAQHHTGSHSHGQHAIAGTIHNHPNAPKVSHSTRPPTTSPNPAYTPATLNPSPQTDQGPTSKHQPAQLQPTNGQCSQAAPRDQGTTNGNSKAGQATQTHAGLPLQSPQRPLDSAMPVQGGPETHVQGSNHQPPDLHMTTRPSPQQQPCDNDLRLGHGAVVFEQNDVVAGAQLPGSHDVDCDDGDDGGGACDLDHDSGWGDLQMPDGPNPTGRSPRNNVTLPHHTTHTHWDADPNVGWQQQQQQQQQQHTSPHQQQQQDNHPRPEHNLSLSGRKRPPMHRRATPGPLHPPPQPPRYGSPYAAIMHNYPHNQLAPWALPQQPVTSPGFPNLPWALSALLSPRGLSPLNSPHNNFSALHTQRTPPPLPEAAPQPARDLTVPDGTAQPDPIAPAAPMQQPPQVPPLQRPMPLPLHYLKAHGGHLPPLPRGYIRRSADGTEGDLVVPMRGKAPVNKWQKKYPRAMATWIRRFNTSKLAWEDEEMFTLPGGQHGSWVLVARPGNALANDHGLVFCRLCMHQNEMCALTKGMITGKHCALIKHTHFGPHVELMKKLAAGSIPPPPRYDELREEPMPNMPEQDLVALMVQMGVLDQAEAPKVLETALRANAEAAAEAAREGEGKAKTGRKRRGNGVQQESDGAGTGEEAVKKPRKRKPKGVVVGEGAEQGAAMLASPEDVLSALAVLAQISQGTLGGSMGGGVGGDAGVVAWHAGGSEGGLAPGDGQLTEHAAADAMQSVQDAARQSMQLLMMHGEGAGVDVGCCGGGVNNEPSLALPAPNNNNTHQTPVLLPPPQQQTLPQPQPSQPQQQQQQQQPSIQPQQPPPAQPRPPAPPPQRPKYPNMISVVENAARRRAARLAARDGMGTCTGAGGAVGTDGYPHAVLLSKMPMMPNVKVGAARTQADGPPPPNPATTTTAVAAAAAADTIPSLAQGGSAPGEDLRAVISPTRHVRTHHPPPITLLDEFRSPRGLAGLFSPTCLMPPSSSGWNYPAPPSSGHQWMLPGPLDNTPLAMDAHLTGGAVPGPFSPFSPFFGPLSPFLSGLLSPVHNAAFASSPGRTAAPPTSAGGTARGRTARGGSTGVSAHPSLGGTGGTGSTPRNNGGSARTMGGGDSGQGSGGAAAQLAVHWMTEDTADDGINTDVGGARLEQTGGPRSERSGTTTVNTGGTGRVRGVGQPNSARRQLLPQPVLGADLSRLSPQQAAGLWAVLGSLSSLPTSSVVNALSSVLKANAAGQGRGGKHADALAGLSLTPEMIAALQQASTNPAAPFNIAGSGGRGSTQSLRSPLRTTTTHHPGGQGGTSASPLGPHGGQRSPSRTQHRQQQRHHQPRPGHELLTPRGHYAPGGAPAHPHACTASPYPKQNATTAAPLTGVEQSLSVHLNSVGLDREAELTTEPSLNAATAAAVLAPPGVRTAKGGCCGQQDLGDGSNAPVQVQTRKGSKSKGSGTNSGSGGNSTDTGTQQAMAANGLIVGGDGEVMAVGEAGATTQPAFAMVGDMMTDAGTAPGMHGDTGGQQGQGPDEGDGAPSASMVLRGRGGEVGGGGGAGSKGRGAVELTARLGLSSTLASLNASRRTSRTSNGGGVGGGGGGNAEAAGAATAAGGPAVFKPGVNAGTVHQDEGAVAGVSAHVQDTCPVNVDGEDQVVFNTTQPHTTQPQYVTDADTAVNRVVDAHMLAPAGPHSHTDDIPPAHDTPGNGVGGGPGMGGHTPGDMPCVVPDDRTTIITTTTSPSPPPLLPSDSIFPSLQEHPSIAGGAFATHQLHAANDIASLLGPGGFKPPDMPHLRMTNANS